MAIMYPSNIESYNYTDSEKFFYDKLKEKLSDEFRVFYSIRWFKNVNGNKETSECDFLVFHPNYGYITIEVKGGVSLEIQGDEWRILDSHSSDSYRVLRRSPFKQAEESMYYFKDYYEENFAAFYKGTYGFAVALPFYNIKQDIGISYPSFLVLDKNSIDNLEERIIEIFKYWRGKYRNYLPFSYDQQVKFIKILNKRISLSAAAGALIEMRQKELDKVNRVQDNYIEFISNYNKVFIIGGAGTGKTWIGIKKAIKDCKEGKTTLIVTPGKLLCDYIKQQTEWDIDIKCFDELSDSMLGSYDSIIVDEGQDFNDVQIELIIKLLIDYNKSNLYVMYDKNQNINDINFKDGFGINHPPFILNENIRNTDAIHNWVIRQTGIGSTIKPSGIEGLDPEIYNYRDEKAAVFKLEFLLDTLIKNECIKNESIVILSNLDFSKSVLNNTNYIGKYSFIDCETKVIKILNYNEILFYKDIKYKGLESDIVIYINHDKNNKNLKQKYIAYTRARFYLYVINLI